MTDQRRRRGSYAPSCKRAVRRGESETDRQTVRQADRQRERIAVG